MFNYDLLVIEAQVWILYSCAILWSELILGFTKGLSKQGRLYVNLVGEAPLLNG